MKLSSQIDLEPLKDLAIERVNLKFFENVQKLTFYNAKFEWARAETPPFSLVEEAQLKNISVEDLRNMIISKHNEADNDLMSAEIQRQKDNLSIRGATTEQELKRWLA